ncbi:hypothetical protein MTR_7g057030 [Medicago truncatula]|uniref:Gag-pol polyprotein n=1 Tax=Medicago truncatula TaxID=3880 RepID=G7L090_MEDTR|nr:hypothetical protein MTR_7g057030 [Medicago truncatula]
MSNEKLLRKIFRSLPKKFDRKVTESQGDHVHDECLSEDIMLLGRQFNRILKQVNKIPRRNGLNIRFDISKQQNNVKKTRLMRRAVNPRESSVMNVKDMVTLDQNVPHFSRDKRKSWLFLGLMKMTLVIP